VTILAVVSYLSPVPKPLNKQQFSFFPVQMSICQNSLKNSVK